jgi:hypothetical protein
MRRHGADRKVPVSTRQIPLEKKDSPVGSYAVFPAFYNIKERFSTEISDIGRGAECD